MWQEARKQEKILRDIMVDYRRRAERRKGYYEKIKKDPAQFLQVWGKQMKIRLDENIENDVNNQPIMTKWQGDEETFIDRFDVRSHLDHLPEYQDNNEIFSDVIRNEEKYLNYERYKTLIQNEALGITEQQCLKQIEIDEKYGLEVEKNEKKSKETKAEIAYSYENSILKNSSSTSQTSNLSLKKDSSNEESEEDFDLNLDVNKLSSEDKVILNKSAINFGLDFGDFIHMMILDNEEKEILKKNKMLEIEKAHHSGRKSRRERKIAKEKYLRERVSLSSLSFIVSETYDENKNKKHDDTSDSCDSYHYCSSKNAQNRKREDTSRSRSKSPTRSENNYIDFITSFGQENDEEYLSNTNNLNPNYLDAFLLKKSSLNENCTNLKKLKQNFKRSLSKSKSRSTSPSLNKNAKIGFLNENNVSKKVIPSSNESNSSDDEKALQNYFERKENRKSQNEKSSVNRSNSSTTNSTDDEENKIKFNKARIASIKNKKLKPSQEFCLIQEKLKKKMQKDIDKQFKKDRKLEKEKKRKEEEERRKREAKLEYLTEKINKRKHIKRYHDDTSSESNSSLNRSSRSCSRSESRSRIRSTFGKNRSRSSSKRSSRSSSRDFKKSKSNSKAYDKKYTRISLSSTSSTSSYRSRKSSFYSTKPKHRRSRSSSSTSKTRSRTKNK